MMHRARSTLARRPLLPALLAASLLLSGCGENGGNDGPEAPTPSPALERGARAVMDENFDEVTRSGVALIDFWSRQCPPCLRQGPIVDRLAETFKGRALVGKVDVASNRETPRRYGVQLIPTLVVLRDGREVERFVGLQDEETLASALEEALAGE